MGWSARRTAPAGWAAWAACLAFLILLPLWLKPVLALSATLRGAVLAGGWTLALAAVAAFLLAAARRRRPRGPGGAARP